jgi:UDP-N-acetylmuramyl pentapeptide phosphotransferase/UDP-N-acetylglucosamine-1-phosphate transferase
MIIIKLIVVAVVSFGLCRFFISRPHKALLDHPGDRSLHDIPVPRSGGLAIAAGFFLACIFFWESVVSVVHPFVVVLMLVLCAVSLWDDFSSLSQGVRLVTQLILAAVVVFPLDLFWLPDEFASAEIFFRVFSLLGIVWVINLYNFMDGMDGFAGGMSLFGFGTYALLGWWSGAADFALFNLLVCAAVAGFWVCNLPPAGIFMGDLGSTLLGFLAAILGLVGCASGIFDPWVPLVIFSPFWVDATYTLVKRMLKKEPFWLPHRQHFYQRLVLSGLGHGRVLALEYILMSACSLTVLLAITTGMGYNQLVAYAWFCVYLLLLPLLEKKLQGSGG